MERDREFEDVSNIPINILDVFEAECTNLNVSLDSLSKKEIALKLKDIAPHFTSIDDGNILLYTRSILPLHIAKALALKIKDEREKKEKTQIPSKAPTWLEFLLETKFPGLALAGGAFVQSLTKDVGLRVGLFFGVFSSTWGALAGLFALRKRRV